MYACFFLFHIVFIIILINVILVLILSFYYALVVAVFVNQSAREYNIVQEMSTADIVIDYS